MASGPSWYDILGVRRDATPAEVKAAWRDATDKFEPGAGSSQFRLFNEAADVLLDPQRRAAYDAELDAQGQQVPVPQPATGAATDTPTPARATVPVTGGPAAAYADEEGTEEGSAGDTGRRPATTRLVAAVVALGVLAAVAVAAAVVLGYKSHRNSEVQDARDEAPAAAERALESVLSYDYRHLGADEQRAARFLTARYKRQKHFAATYRLLEEGANGAPGPAVTTKTVVTAHAVGSAVVGAEPDLARVLVFVNQTSQKAGKDPMVFQNRVVVTLVRIGNAWLIDDLKSY